MRKTTFAKKLRKAAKEEETAMLTHFDMGTALVHWMDNFHQRHVANRALLKHGLYNESKMTVWACKVLPDGPSMAYCHDADQKVLFAMPELETLFKPSALRRMLQALEAVGFYQHDGCLATTENVHCIPPKLPRAADAAGDPAVTGVSVEGFLGFHPIDVLEIDPGSRSPS